MNNQDPCRGLFLPEEEEEENDNQQERGGTDYGVNPSFSEMSGLFLQNATPTSFTCFSTTESAPAAHYMYYNNLMSESFELPMQKMASPCNDGGESSGSRRKYEQFPESNQEDGPYDNINPSEEYRKPKKTRSAEVHNLTERIRRQRLKEKMKSLQELIPNCSKRDKASTLDDAIKYIKTLQYQLQMMSMGQSFTMLHSPWMLQSSGHHQEMQIPTLPQFLQTGPRTEIGLGDGIGMSGLSSSMNLPITSNLALPSPNSSASAASRFPLLSGLSEALLTRTPTVLESSPSTTSSYTNLEPFSGTSFPLPVYQQTTKGETSSSQDFASKK